MMEDNVTKQMAPAGKASEAIIFKFHVNDFKNWFDVWTILENTSFWSQIFINQRSKTYLRLKT